MSGKIDLVGVGSPIMDLLAPVEESFLAGIRGEKGGMVLVDDTEMARMLSLLGVEPAMTTGGSAANATLGAARLGLRTSFVGKLGGDSIAGAYIRRFRSLGVDTGRFKRGPLPNARCLALVTPDAQRTMRTSLGAAMTLAAEEISIADFRGCRHAHIEGYLVFNRALCGAVLDAARAAGCSISLDVPSYEVIADSREWLLGQIGRGIDVVFANEDEIRALFPGRGADYRELALELASRGALAAVKLGKDGAWIARGAELHRIPPVRVTDALDSNGAGDAWAAGFLFGFLRGQPLAACGAIGSILGAETVRHLGPHIPDALWPEVLRRVAAAAPAPGPA
jgi:sugar/nucleoside kinase (ribokinase family)